MVSEVMGIGILFEDVKVDTKTSEVTVRSEWQPGFMDVMAVGRNGLTDDLRNRMEDQAAVGRLAAAEWTDLTASLSEADCWDLLRGFVTLETQLGWRGGSVAAGNLLGRAFVQRFPHRWQEAVVWLRGHAKGNPWYFTKHSPLSFDSAEEWHRFIAADRQRQEQTAQANAERKASRIAEARQNHQQRLEHQREKQTQRRQAIDKLANVSPVERLCIAVSDLSVGLDFYPSSWGVLPKDQRSQVPSQAVQALLKRSTAATGRSWRPAAKLFREDLEAPLKPADGSKD